MSVINIYCCTVLSRKANFIVLGFVLFCFLKIVPTFRNTIISKKRIYVLLNNSSLSCSSMPQSKIVFQKDSVSCGSALKHSWGRNLFLFMWELQLVYTPFGGFADADLINMEIAFDASAQISIPITFISQDNCFSWINIKSGCQYFPRS